MQLPKVLEVAQEKTPITLTDNGMKSKNYGEFLANQLIFQIHVGGSAHTTSRRADVAVESTEPHQPVQAVSTGHAHRPDLPEEQFPPVRVIPFLLFLRCLNVALQQPSVPLPVGPGGAWHSGPIKAWNAHELEMRQFEQLGQQVDNEIPQPALQPNQHHRQPYPQQPMHGNPPFVPPHFIQQQMFLQQHALHARQAEVSSCFNSLGGDGLCFSLQQHFERKQGVYDMASIEEQLLKNSIPSGPPTRQQPMPVMRHNNPWGNPSVGEPQLPVVHDPAERRKMHEQELHRFRQLQEQQHHHQPIRGPESDQHTHPFLGGVAPEADPKVSPFQAMWGLNFDTSFSIHEIEAKIIQEREEEERKNQAKLEQERKQQPTQARAATKGAPQPKPAAQPKQKQQPTQANWKPQEEGDGIEGEVVEDSRWDALSSAPQPVAKQPSSGSKRAGAGGAAHGSKTQGAAAKAPAWGGGAVSKPVPLHELQQQERSESASQQQQQPNTKDTGMQDLLSTWGIEVGPTGQEQQHGKPAAWGAKEDDQSAQSKRPATRNDQKSQKRSAAAPAPTEPQVKKAGSDFAWGGSVPTEAEKRPGSKVDLRLIQEEEMKQHVQKQHEMHAMHQRALAVAREQQNRWASPWGAATQDGGEPRSFRFGSYRHLS